MGFMDDVSAEQANRKPGYKCRTCVAIHSFSAKDRDEINAVMADNAYSTAAIVAVMRRRGLDVSDNSVGKHRREAHGA